MDEHLKLLNERPVSLRHPSESKRSLKRMIDAKKMALVAVYIRPQLMKMVMRLQAVV